MAFKRDGKLLPHWSPRLIAIAVGCAALGALVFGSLATMVRGCRSDRVQKLEERVTRLETTLGIADARALAEGGAPVASPPAPAASGSANAEDSPECAIAKVNAYRSWQEAVAKAKANSAPAQAACAHVWSEEKKQQCYYTASSAVRTAQAARDAVVSGGANARNALKNVKDDPKNEAIERARAASEAAFAACHDENEY